MADSPCNRPDVAGQKSSTFTLIVRLRFLLALASLSIVEFVAIGPSVQYIILTFFAASHGGGDCELTPASSPCRKAATDAAFYGGVSSGICTGAGALLALTLGFRSDHLGRRPIIRVRAWLSLLPIATLALHVFGGWTLWLFLVASPLFRAFDISGVMLAFVADVITDPEDRAAAIGAFITTSIAVVVLVLPFAGLLPMQANILISMAATVGKVAFVYRLFPETLRVRSDGRSAQHMWYTPLIAMRIITRHSVILRMALVLVLSSLSSAGLNTIMAPYLTAYFGLTRANGTKLLLMSIASAVAGLALGIKPLVGCLGEVGALRSCLGTAVLFPLALTLCQNVVQIEILTVLLSAPLFMLVPIISGIKSNLVGKDEQGIVQGGLACICNLATATSDIVFGYIFRRATGNGEIAARSSLFPLFFACAAFAAASWLLALSLPRQLPCPAHKDGDSITAEPLLRAEGA